MRVLAFVSRRRPALPPILLASALLAGCGGGSDLPGVAPPPSRDDLAEARPKPEPKPRPRTAAGNQTAPPPTPIPQPSPTSLKTAQP